MFQRLFSEAGLSLDRLRALVEVGAAGSIARAAGDDPVRQSQFSRQIKELEDFFQTGLVERHGRGIRLTAGGRELARISRFFLLGLSNFQRGCLEEGQAYRIGARPTFTSRFLLPVLSDAQWRRAGIQFAMETLPGEEAERRLHDLTLDFAVVNRPALSRPLRTEPLGTWPLSVWIPKRLCRGEKAARRDYEAGQVPCALAAGELPGIDLGLKHDPALACASLLDALRALESEALAAALPTFLAPAVPERFHRLLLRGADQAVLGYWLAWNPRLMRLNPHAGRRKDALVAALRQANSKSWAIVNHPCGMGIAP